MSNKKPLSEATSQMKVTYTCTADDNGFPSQNVGSDDRPAILMWREDYERLIAELEESRKWKPFARGYYKREGEVVHFATRGTYDDEGK